MSISLNISQQLRWGVSLAGHFLFSAQFMITQQGSLENGDIVASSSCILLPGRNVILMYPQKAGNKDLPELSTCM
jgi:hypothetical protein